MVCGWRSQLIAPESPGQATREQAMRQTRAPNRLKSLLRRTFAACAGPSSSLRMPQ